MRDNCQCPLHAAFLQQQQKAPMYPHAIGSKKTNKQTNKQTEHLPHAAGSSQVLFFFFCCCCYCYCSLHVAQLWVPLPVNSPLNVPRMCELF